MPYTPSLQLLAFLRALDRPLVCQKCCRALPRPLRLGSERFKRTFLSEPTTHSIEDRRHEKVETRRAFLAQNERPLYQSSLASKKGILAKWELTVGIEIHAELNTNTKLFSPALTSLGDTPNTHVSVFDVALPGAQPQFQKETLLPALRAALALGCEIQRKSSWDRKHYFWWDQPNGYQITQYYEPFAKNGQIVLYAHDDIDAADHPSIKIDIKQVQLEQDTAKTILQPPSTHLLDFNRVSHPLIEIITLPQLHSPKTAAALVRKVQSILKAVDANTTGMEMGGLRADVNVSVRRKNQNLADEEGLSYGGVNGLGQRTEIKNLSSFKAVEEAIEAERDRQISILEGGGTIQGETRGWTLGQNETRMIRRKEGEVDYRYMPDPDLGLLLIGQDLIDHLRVTLPSLPDDMLKLLIEGVPYGITTKDARTLITLDNGERLDYYLHVVHLTCSRLSSTSSKSNLDDLIRNVGRHAANLILHDLGALLASSVDGSWAANKVTSSHAAQILYHRLLSHITLPTAKRLLWLALNGSFDIPGSASREGDMSRHSDEAIEDTEATAISNYIHLKNLKLKPMSDKEYLALAMKIIFENPKMAETVKKEESGGMESSENGAAVDTEDLTRKRTKGRGKMMWFVGQMLSKGDGPRMVPDQCKKAIRRVLAQTSI